MRLQLLYSEGAREKARHYRRRDKYDRREWRESKLLIQAIRKNKHKEKSENKEKKNTKSKKKDKEKGLLYRSRRGGRWPRGRTDIALASRPLLQTFLFLELHHLFPLLNMLQPHQLKLLSLLLPQDLQVLIQNFIVVRHLRAAGIVRSVVVGHIHAIRVLRPARGRVDILQGMTRQHRLKQWLLLLRLGE